MGVRCVKIKLKPGSLPRVRAWAVEVDARREEALAIHELDAYHAQFKKDTWESGRQLELLVDLERLKP